MSALDYSENIQFGSGNEQSSSNGNETKSKSKSSTYFISGAKMFMKEINIRVMKVEVNKQVRII